MKHVAVILAVFFLSFFNSGLNAQAGFKNWHLELRFEAGGSKLFHKTRFETTPLYNLYQFVAFSHPGGYSWDEFLHDYKINSSFSQPRFGFSMYLTYQDLPLFASVEALSSTSGFRKVSYSVSGGIANDFAIINDEYFISGLVGYKFTKDFGLGSNTIVNSIGLKEARKLAETFFAPVEPLGTDRGHLFIAHLGIGKKFNHLKVGLKVYGELDLTSPLKRQARMTNAGFNAYVSFFL